MVSGALFLSFPLSGAHQAAFSLVVVALLLVPVGMVGFHILQRHSYGRIGLVGFWLVVVASLVVAFGVVNYFVWGDFLQEEPPVWLGLGLLGLVVGFVIYGVATLRAKVLPLWCGVAFIVTLLVALAVGVLLGPFVSIFIVFGLSWLALGYALWARREALEVQQPRRVR